MSLQLSFSWSLIPGPAILSIFLWDFLWEGNTLQQNRDSWLWVSLVLQPRAILGPLSTLSHRREELYGITILWKGWSRQSPFTFKNVAKKLLYDDLYVCLLMFWQWLSGSACISHHSPRAGELPVPVHHTAHVSLLAATTAIPLFALQGAVSAVLSSVRKVVSVWKELPCNPSCSWRCCQPKSDQHIRVMQTSTPPNYAEPQGQGNDASLSPMFHGKTVAYAATKSSLAVRQTAWPHLQLL